MFNLKFNIKVNTIEQHIKFKYLNYQYLFFFFFVFSFRTVAAIRGARGEEPYDFTWQR